ncbi:MAG: hypothetical protein JO224_01250 [Pelomonas sp.]|nr:hypothetical protein [Roseateles sp.]
MVAAGTALGAEVVGAVDGWTVVIHHGRVSQTLTAQRGEPRSFRKFETVVAYLKTLGITELRVKTAGFVPADAGRKPGDKRGELASERMKRAHEAAAHDKWFREQVEQALAEADAPDAEPSIPHAEVKKRMAARRAELLTRMGRDR